MIIHLPDDIILPLDLSEAELKLELALALYAAKKLSFGKARQLADMDWFTFRQKLDERGISAHYDVDDFEQDMNSLSHLSKS